MKAASICYEFSDDIFIYLQAAVVSNLLSKKERFGNVLMNKRQTMEIKTINSRIKTITINLNGLFICNSKNDCVMPAFNVVAAFVISQYL